jgi:hypothetical protein
MISAEDFEQGLRLDQYMASIERNKENFRANFIKAIELVPADDLAFFRKLPKTNVLVITDDENADALRDVPIISRISVELGSLKLRMYRATKSAHIIDKLCQTPPADCTTGPLRIPIIAFFTSEMKLINLFCERIPELSAEMKRRHQEWVVTHPEVRDAAEPIDKMTPITRTRILQTIFAMTPDQRSHWGRKTVKAWRDLLTAAA